MNDATAMHAHAHPAPHRGRVDLLASLYGIAAGPLAWGAHLLVNYGVTSHACFPGAAPRSTPPPGAGALWSLLLAIDLIAMAIAASAALVSYRAWRASRREVSGHAGELIEVGEGRTRFLALWGMITGGGFLIVIAFDLVGLLVLPLCE
jgi:hypothetical protein